MENQLFYLQTNSYESWMMMNDFVGFDKSEEKKYFMKFLKNYYLQTLS